MSIELKKSVVASEKVDDRKGPLFELAKLHSIATSYIGADKNFVSISENAIKLALNAIGVKTGNAAEIKSEIEKCEIEKWAKPTSQTIVTIDGQTVDEEIFLPAKVADNFSKHELVVITENGKRFKIENLSESIEEKVIEKTQLQKRIFEIPSDLGEGYHKLWLDDEIIATVISTPETAPIPNEQMCGVMTQLYSARSENSWGIGDFENLKTIGKTVVAELGADFVLINPVHADYSSLPQTNSPYSPASREFLNPIYIRPESIPEYQTLPPYLKTAVDSFFNTIQPLNRENNLINRDAIWALKMQALKMIFAAGFDDTARKKEFEDFKTEAEGDHCNLTRFAVWNLIVDLEGRHCELLQSRDHSSRWKELAAKHADDIEFYRYLQFIAAEQLCAAQTEIKNAGAKIGIIKDLAVGVNRSGADVWNFPASFVKGMSVGAPPDLYNQVGQNWALPPFSPARLEKTGYEDFVRIVRSALKDAGAVRIDHILGMFRLWWVPEGFDARSGVYVYYNHDALIGILCLEAKRAGAFIIGEDMGTIPAGVFDYLKSRGILGTSVLFFERHKDGTPKKSSKLRQLCLSSVTTHDIPPTLGFLKGDHVELRTKLGLLSEKPEKVLKNHQVQKQLFVKNLIEQGLLKQADQNDDNAICLAFNLALKKSPSLLICHSLADLVGERRTENQPGTVDEYPNWRVPLANENLELVDIDQLAENESFKKFKKALSTRG